MAAPSLPQPLPWPPKRKLKAEKGDAKGKESSTEEIVRPRVSLNDCLDCFSAPEEVHDFYSTALKSKTTAIKTVGLTSFPDYLVLHMRKFVLEAGWVPKKLDDEKLSSADENIVAQLRSVGFSHLQCQKAAINTSNTGVEAAMNWLLSHMDDPDINNPISKQTKGSNDLPSFVDQSKADALISFVFQEELARKALKATGGDVEKATNWIFDNPDASCSSEMDATTSENNGSAPDATLPDGSGRYRLIGIVSHIGTSTQCGHYVAHVYKDGRWVIFNDAKVGVSKDPPLDMGYLYFFERLD